MRNRFGLIAALIGGLMIVGTAFLPIDPAAVRLRSVESLVRDGLKQLKPADGSPPLAVQVRLEGVPEATVLPLVSAPIQTLQGPDGKRRAPAFAVGTTGPVLQITARDAGGRVEVAATLADRSFSQSVRLGDWMSLLPPLVALILAVAFRRVILALFLAVMTGATVAAGGNPFSAFWLEIKGLVGAGLKLVGSDAVAADGVFAGVLSSSFKLQVLGFTAALIGLVAVVARMGGTRGLVDALSPFARGPRSAQAVTGVMGLAIFFDDYANSLVVGTTGRSLTDRHRISREKLAYIVDCTAAPVAGVAVISTWIGYEVGLFDDLLGVLSSVPHMASSGYELFFQLLPLRFYCIFALVLVFLTAWTRRDLGPMYHAERRARSGGGVLPGGEAATSGDILEKPGVKPRALNAILPIGAVVGTIVAWIIIAGTADLATFSPLSLADWKKVFETPAVADGSAFIMLCAALIGSAVAFALALGQRLLTGKECLTTWLKGVRTLVEAFAILILAWAIKAICDQLGTGTAMVVLVGDSLPPVALPLAVFVLSGAVAFATGTSWGTMA
ncbi:MAG: hypothetical protein KC549_05770, partial [Myxococcales bacterium]|nr:hypothetical protein [Myxococcales bacterium]